MNENGQPTGSMTLSVQSPYTRVLKLHLDDFQDVNSDNNQPIIDFSQVE